ncbi:MAG: DUF5829 family protein [Planctomycetota bacterium]
MPIAHLVLAAPAQEPEGQGTPPEQARPLLTPSDYGRWESFGRGPHAISPDGQWLAFPVERVNGRDELRVRSLVGEAEHVAPFGSKPRFSKDSKHLLWTTGHSEEERKRTERAGKPLRAGAALRDLAGGDVRTFDGVRAARFDESGRYVALHGHADEGREPRPADLRVLDLAGGELTFGNVTEFAWSETAPLLAFVVRTEADGGNGVRLYDPRADRLLSLDTSASDYGGLAWCEEAPHLAVFRSRADAGDEEPAQAVLAWRDVGTDAAAGFVLDPEAGAVPAGMDAVRFESLRWSDAGDKLSFGLRKAGSSDPKEQPEGEDEEELSGVQVWHPGDVRIFPEQKVREKEDRERALRAVWNLDRADVIQVGTDPLARATVLEGWSFALEQISEPYPWGAMFGRPFHDVWRVDLEQGERTRLLERVRYSWPSAGGRYLLTFDGVSYACVRLADGRRVNLTRELDSSFADEEYDTPTDMLPPYGVGGWLGDDEAVLLYDRYDVWRVAPDGGSATRLTRGAEEGVQHRVVDLDEDEESFDPDDALYFRTWSERSEQRGFARLLPAAAVAESLLFVDKMPWRLTRAEEAETFVFTLEAVDDSPDFFVSGPDLAGARQVTETNPFQADYAWTRAELVNFDSEAGVPLQAALYYPADHDPSRRYPMIVWTYEKETPWVHIYDVPDERDYYNFTTWTQRGYFVLLMDIAYRPRDPGICAIEAVRPAIGSVVERGLVDEARVGLVGHSWGGYQAAYLPTRTELFAASVAGAPLTDFVSFMGQIHWGTGTAEPDHWETGQARMEVPFWEDPEAHRRNSPLHGVQDLDTPMLLAHGLEDGVVEFFQSSVFYNYARRAGKQVVLLAYEGEDHGFRQEANQVDYHRRILEWFDHYLQDAPAPDWMRVGTEVVELEREKRRVAQTLPPSASVALNHFYAVLDEETFAALRASDFLGESFAAVDTGLPDFSAVDERSVSLYIRGKDTYIELLGPDNRFGEPVGKVGLALGVDDPAHLDDVERVWNDRLGGEVIRQQHEWRRATPPVPWYEVLLHPDTLASPTVVVWASAYRPEFLPWLYPERSAAENGVRRADFLAPRFDSERLLENVTGVTLALPEELRGGIARQLEAVGYDRAEAEGCVRLQGRDWCLSLVEPSGGRTGLVGIELSTTREKEGAPVVRFGTRAVMMFGPDRTASWAFL